MWLSNVATMTLMLPIVEAILLQIENLSRKRCRQALMGETKPEAGHELEVVELNVEKEQIIATGTDDDSDDSEGGASLNRSDSKITQLAKALTLSVGYSGKLGGMAMLTGTPPNLILKSLADE